MKYYRSFTRVEKGSLYNGYIIQRSVSLIYSINNLDILFARNSKNKGQCFKIRWKALDCVQCAPVALVILCARV